MRMLHHRLGLQINNDEVNPKMFTGLVASRALYSLGTGMVLLFIPIYLFKLQGLWLLTLWLMLSQMADFLMIKINARAVANLGFKKSVILGQILWAVGLCFLFLSKNNLWFLIPAGIITEIAQDCFWISNHMLFLMTPAKKFGSDMSMMEIICMWSGVLGPILGGFFVTGSGFGEVFGIGAILMLLAAIPVLILEPDNLHWDFHLRHYWEKIGDHWFTKDLTAFLGYGMEDAMYNYFWPVFLLVILKNSYTDLGLYKTVILAVTSSIEWVVGKRIDKGGVHKYMIWGTGVLMFFWIMRGLLSKPWQLMGLDMLDGWIGIVVWLPFMVYTYRRATLADKPLYVVEREAAIRLGKALTGVILGLMVAFGLGWNVMVTVGILGLILMNLLPRIGPKHLEAIMTEEKK